MTELTILDASTLSSIVGGADGDVYFLGMTAHNPCWANASKNSDAYVSAMNQDAAYSGQRAFKDYGDQVRFAGEHFIQDLKRCPGFGGGK
jgi:hypothetical protein